MSDSTYDVCVIGAGPAGCSAAYQLSQNGLSVLLIDKSEFPRIKPCAGGITIKSIQALPYAITPVIKRICRNIVIGNGQTKKTLFSSKSPLCAMTIRSEFDAFCLQKTIERGAAFEVHSKIVSIETTGHHIEIKTSRSVIFAKYLLGADGVNSTVRKLTNVFSDLKKATAVEGKVYLSESQMPDLEIDFGYVKNGYGWIFPKHDHVNIGLYSYSPNEKLGRSRLEEYAKAKFPEYNLKEIEGFQMGINTQKYIPKSPNIFLIGDAAGLVDSLLGEGIFNALKSGQLVAEAIINATKDGSSALQNYSLQLEKLQKELDICQNSADWFYNNLKKGYFALTTMPVKYCLMKGFASGLTFGQTKKGFLRLFFIKSPISKLR
jgi:geranylgeranyl reductase family protein